LDWIIVIPARLNSKRLPNKPLLEIHGKTLIQRTYERALAAVNDKEKIIIATDSLDIVRECERFNARFLLTSPDCLTGTDRVAEVARKIKARQYINLQGDEPIFPIEEIKNFIDSCKQNTDVVHTAIIPIKNGEDYFNRSIPKMVFTNRKKLLYSSRAPIPFNKKGTFQFGYKHVCIYAFNKEDLDLFSKNTNKTMFEAEEDLEINRFLELGIYVNCIELKKCGKAVDNSEDLAEVKKIISSHI